MIDLERPWFTSMLSGSVALHLLVVAVLPSRVRAPVNKAPVVIEMIEPPAPSPPETPPPAREEPAPAPTISPLPARAVVTNVARTASDRPAAAESASAEAPVDFTSTVMSNEGPGLAIGGGGGRGTRGTAGAASLASAQPVRATSSPPRIVPPSDLARPPRAPGLDAALEQNYPLDARRSGVSGKAVLRVTILPDGRVAKVVRVEESLHGFGEACEKTVRSGRWEPPIDREGHVVGTEITYTCRFEIRG